MTKYLLCRPVGGFNDTLVQISWCVDYCLRFGRELILDTVGSGIGCDFSDLFEVTSLPVTTRIFSTFREANLNEMTTSPSSLEGRIDSYNAVGLTGEIGLFEANSLQKITFWRAVDHSQQLLVHHGGGGGSSSKRILRYLKVKPEVADLISTALLRLPTRYDAIHIRNTDYKSAWEAILARVGKKADRNIPVVVFSDDFRVLESARAKDNIFLPSPLRKPRDLEGPLHNQVTMSADMRRELAIEMVAELVAMYAARTFYYSRTRGRRGSPKSPVSGFSTLVASSRSAWRDGRPLGLDHVLVESSVGDNRRVRLFAEELRALTKFLSFYVRKIRSAVGRFLGR